MNDACSDTRNATASATSRGSPIRPNGAACREAGLGRGVEHGCRDRPREHGVDPDARRRELRGRRLGETAQRPFGRAVCGVVGERPDRTGAARVDDGGTVGRSEMGKRGTDSEERPEAVEPPAPLETCGSFVFERRPVQDPRVVDQRRQGTEPVDDLAGGGGPLVFGGDIEGHRGDTVESVDGRLQLVGAHIARGDQVAVPM